MSTLLHSSQSVVSSNNKDSISPSNDTDEILVIVNFSKKNYKFKLSPHDTIAQLRNKIHEQTTVPPSFQKLIIKGKIIQDDQTTLMHNKIKNKTKLLLIGSTIENVINVSSQGLFSVPKKTDKKSTDTDEVEKVYLSEMKEHQKIIKKGVPESAEKGEADKSIPVPKSIKGMYTSQGEEIRFTFKNDIQQLWIASKDKTEKMSYLQIKDVVYEQIHNNKGYCIVGLQIGNTPNSKLWYYFLPTQYVKSLKYTLLGGGQSAFPFLKE